MGNDSVGFYKYKPAGDRGVLVELGSEISENVHRKVISFMYCIEANHIYGIEEVIPAYCTLLILYDPMIISYFRLIKKLNFLEMDSRHVRIPPAEIIHIPVLYGGEFGEDLPFVAEYNSLTPDELIRIHSENEYLIYMLGFAPGFPYLGGLSKKIFTPRLSTPRKNLIAGSVGIGGEQTGIYPIDSPGGWRIIGRTPIKLFNIESEDVVLLHPGQYVKFEPICSDEYNEIHSKVLKGNYQVKKTIVEREGIND